MPLSFRFSDFTGWWKKVPKVDTTPPLVSITSIGGADSTVSSQSGDAAVVGKAEPSRSVTISSGTATLGVTTADASGNFSYALAAANLTLLGQGAGKSITATQSDAAGNTGSSSPFVFTSAVPLTWETPTYASAMPIQGGAAGQAGATGWAHTGVTLKPWTGGMVLDGRAAPLVIDGYDIYGELRIMGDVTLKRSRVTSSSSNEASPAIKLESSAGTVLIEDVEITTGNPNALGGQPRLDRTIGMTSKNTDSPVTLRRLYTHDSIRGLDITGQKNVTIEDSYLGPNASPPIGQPPGSTINNTERAHASAIRAAGGVSHLRINNTVLHIGAASWASGLIATYPEWGNNSDIIIDGGRWIVEGNNDGAFGIAAGTPDTSTGFTNSDFHVKNVQISTQFYSVGCPSGCAQNWNQIARDGISTWSGVTKYNPGFADHGQIINP